MNILYNNILNLLYSIYWTKKPLDESERGELKSWLKAQHSENEDHGIWSHHFMANKWGNSGRLYFLDSKITADSDYSHEIKTLLLLGRKVMTNLYSIFKSRDITLPTKVHLVKAMVFPVVMYGCESWTVKKAERQRTDAFELWCWRRLLRVPWTTRRSKQSILNEISPGCSSEELMVKLKLQYCGHAMQRVDWLEKTLMLGGIWGQEEKGTTEDEVAGWHYRLDGHEFGWTLGVGELWELGQGGLACCNSWGHKESDTTERLNWTKLNWISNHYLRFPNI